LRRLLLGRRQGVDEEDESACGNPRGRKGHLTSRARCVVKDTRGKRRDVTETRFGR